MHGLSLYIAVASYVSILRARRRISDWTSFYGRDISEDACSDKCMGRYFTTEPACCDQTGDILSYFFLLREDIFIPTWAIYRLLQLYS